MRKQTDKSPDNGDVNRRRRPKTVTRRRSAVDGEWVSKARVAANPRETVTETTFLPLYRGYVICRPDGKVYDATMHGSRAAAWNVVAGRFGQDRKALHRIGWRVVEGDFVPRAR